MATTKRAYTEIDSFVRDQLKVKAAQHRKSMKYLLEEAVYDKFPDIKQAKEANNATDQAN